MRHLKKLFLIGLSLSFISVSFAGQIKGLDTNNMTATVLPPKAIKPFELKSTDKQIFSDKSLKGHWTFLFFGFTRCGYVCPTSMATLKQAYENLQKKDIQPKPQVIFVSIDPERDNLDRIRHYVTSFNPDFKGATGDKAKLNELASQLGILYMKIVRKGQPANNYDIDHSGTILLVDPAGELVAVFSMPHNADNIAKDYAKITEHYRD